MVELGISTDRDSLIELSPGDEAIDMMTGQRVTNCAGCVSYLIRTNGSIKESDWKIDTTRTVTELIGKNKLPGIWFVYNKNSGPKL